MRKKVINTCLIKKHRARNQVVRSSSGVMEEKIAKVDYKGGNHDVLDQIVKSYLSGEEINYVKPTLDNKMKANLEVLVASAKENSKQDDGINQDPNQANPCFGK